ncbi:hypothetical protein LUZ60_014861 [Juncus effusus]|nr:hypothetical protein LUZ60_014861 [Juncus effusus]
MSATEEPPPPNPNPNPNESPKPQITDPPVSDETLNSQPPTTDAKTSVSDVKEPSANLATPAPSQTHEPGPQTPASSQTHEPGPQTPVSVPNPSPNRPGFANPNVPFHDHARPNFALPFSYGPPAMRFTAPMTPAGLQPPAPSPGQYLSNRPPFGYNNMVPNPPGQQFQTPMQGPRFGLPSNASSLQPPVPMQMPRPNITFPGPGPLNQTLPPNTGPAMIGVSAPGPPLYLNNLSGPGSANQPPQALLQRAPVQPNPVDPAYSDKNKEVNGNNSKKEVETKEKVLEIWTAHRTETGVIYYYNSLTGKSTYEKPAGFKGELENVSAQSVPVSWEKLAGTDWTLVTTNDGKKYYYDTKNKVSSWQVPQEVADLLKKQESETKTETPQTETPQQNPTVSIAPGVTPAVLTAGREAIPLRQTPALISPSALDTIKKKLQDAPGPPDSNTPEGKTEDKDKPKDGNNEGGNGNESESESDSESDESGVSRKEDCINQFKEMLKERGVPPFAKWDKELPKIIFDPRFKAVPTNEARRAIFERYVRTRAEEERKEKKAAQKAATEKFKQLLEEASQDIDHKTDYYSFKKKWGSDPRFKALDRKESEALLNEKVKAAQEKVQASRMAIITDFKSMFRESKEITSKSRWSKVKENFRSDARYKAVKHEERETLFNEYIAELKAAEIEAEQPAKAKLDEQEKLKERERETRKRKEREEQEMERVKLKIRRKDALTSYQALLVEMIKDPMASWKEWKPRLEKDPQGRAANPDLPQEELENVFRDHVKQLYDRYARDFRRVLDEMINAESANRVTSEGKSILNSWSEFKGVLKSDRRFVILPENFKLIWRRYVDDWTEKNKHLLKEETKEKDLVSEAKEKDKVDGDFKRDVRENERDYRRDVKENERDHRRDAKERERKDRDYRRGDLKERERGERDYKRDVREREREEGEYIRGDLRDRERSDRDYRRDYAASNHSRRR